MYQVCVSVCAFVSEVLFFEVMLIVSVFLFLIVPLAVLDTRQENALFLFIYIMQRFAGSFLVQVCCSRQFVWPFVRLVKAVSAPQHLCCASILLMVRITIQRGETPKRRLAGERLLKKLQQLRGWHERHMAYYEAFVGRKAIGHARYIRHFIRNRMSPDELYDGLSTGVKPISVIALPNGPLRTTRQTLLTEFFQTHPKVE